MDDSSPTDAGPGAREPDAHGAAALLLIETLIHFLTARSILSVAEAVEVMDDARDVQIALIAESGLPAPVMYRVLALLDAIAGSLKIDLPDLAGPNAE